MLLQTDEEETRRRLQRATGALTLGLTGDALVNGVMQRSTFRAADASGSPV